MSRYFWSIFVSTQGHCRDVTRRTDIEDKNSTKHQFICIIQETTIHAMTYNSVEFVWPFQHAIHIYIKKSKL